MDQQLVELATTLQQTSDRSFLEAAMAATVLVAMADHDISSVELAIRDYCLQTISQLKIFNATQAKNVFYDYLDVFENGGKAKLLKTIARQSSDPTAANLLISIGLAVAKADYDFSDSERQAIGELCGVLGLDVNVVFAKFRIDETTVKPALDPLTGLSIG